MSDATIQLLTSTGFVSAVGIGSALVLNLIVRAAVVVRPAENGGVLLTAGGAVALATTDQLSVPLLVGLVLLALGGLLPHTSGAAALALAIPGATVIGGSFIDGPNIYLPGVVAVAIVAVAPAVAAFAERHRRMLIATPLAAISLVSVLFVVPDTEEAIVVAGAAAVWIIAGPPAMLTRLGGAGAYAVSGLLVWVVASGGAPRPGSVIAGIATLGFLIAVPVVTLLSERGRDDSTGHKTGGDLSWSVITIVLQIAIGLLMAVIVRVVGGSLVASMLLVSLVLSVAGISMISLAPKVDA